jgi:uncharacterized membrane protein YfcA
MLTDPWFYVAAIPAIALFGLSKGGFGQGLGLLTVPLLSLVMSPLLAVAVTMPLLILMDVVALWSYRRSWDRAISMATLGPVALGAAIGWALANVISEGHVRLLIGLTAVVFVAAEAIKARRAPPPPRVPGRASLWGWVTLSSFASFVSHSGAPALQMYLLPMRLPREVYVGTIAVIFFVMNVLKVPAYAELGLFTGEAMRIAAVLIPVSILSTWAGVWLTRRLDDRRFYGLTYACLLLVGLKLVWDGTRQSFGI